MRYLFFDIECASVLKTTAKICAFGYVLTDEKFNIIEKRDILINPQGGFHLTDQKGKQGLVLPYEYDKFGEYPTFPKVAKEIYALLEDKDSIVVGHATMNDVKYLILETKRFSLRPLKFNFADTQFIYMNRIGTFSRQFGLGTIAEDLKVNFTPHRAVDDAYATMKVAEAMCKAEDVDFIGLLKRYEITLGRTENFEVQQNSSVSYRQYAAEIERKKAEREQRRIAFHEYVETIKKTRKKSGVFKEKIVCFSRPLEDDLERAKYYARVIFSHGGYITYRTDICNLYVYVAGENENGLRLREIRKRNVPAFTVEDFEEILKSVLES